MCAMVSKSLIWGARINALSGLEDLPEIVCLKVMTESENADTHS